MKFEHYKDHLSFFDTMMWSNLTEKSKRKFKYWLIVGIVTILLIATIITLGVLSRRARLKDIDCEEQINRNYTIGTCHLASINISLSFNDTLLCTKCWSATVNITFNQNIFREYTLYTFDESTIRDQLLELHFTEVKCWLHNNSLILFQRDPIKRLVQLECDPFWSRRSLFLFPMVGLVMLGGVMILSFVVAGLLWFT